MNEVGAFHPDTAQGVGDGEGAAASKPGGPGVTQPRSAVSVPLSWDEDPTVLATEEGVSLKWGSTLCKCLSAEQR